ncbi:MAG TPA: type I-E CRISPR-associated protein Cse1/CasA, partial [Mycobacteriales bacterium]|nr:type I-E CRISPR-associated protein Cse1/CasA [Mycobacteriales bacterium]
MTGFNLIGDPWVPVTVDGRRTEVSVTDALTRAHEIDGLALDDPLQGVAVLRQVLLPFVLDALGAPRDAEQWADRWAAAAGKDAYKRDSAKRDAEKLAKHLGKQADRFELFHPTRPFGQVAGLRTAKDETKPVSLLLASVATGNNVPLFTARTEAEPPTLSPAQAARALLAAHCWDTAAIKSGVVGDPQVKAGKTTGNPTGPLGQLGVVVPMGRTLAETLLLNTPILPQGLRPGDRPQWRTEEPASPRWDARPAKGLLDVLTWQSRRIRLIPTTDASGATVVREVVLAAGDRLDQTPQFEPHTAWRQEEKPKAGQPPRRPVRHQPGRSAWRGMAGLLAIRQPTGERVSSSLLLSQVADLRGQGCLPVDLPLRVLTVGVAYGNQSAVVEDVMVDAIPLPVAALAAEGEVRGLLLDVVSQARQLQDAANRLGDDIRRASGGDKQPWDKGQRVGDALVHEFTPVVRRLLAGLQRQPDRADEAEAAWRHSAYRLALQAAEPVLASAPPKAFLGRQENEKAVFRTSVAEARYRAAVRDILGVHPGTTH